MDKKRRYLYILNLFVSGLAVIFIATALGTENWVVASPVRDVEDDIIDSVVNLTDGEIGSKFSGKINVGLFDGYKEIDYAFGQRDGDLKVQCDVGRNLCGFVWSDDENEVQNAIFDFDNLVEVQSNLNDTSGDELDHGLFNCGLFICTVVFAAMAICWGIVSMVFAALNAGIRPIETINGPMGLYIWNSFSALCCVLSIAMYASLFILDLSRNVMSPDDLMNHWTSDGHARLDYSFYFLLISTVLFLLNIVLLAVAGTECRPLRSRFSANMVEKNIDGGVMMY